MESLVTAMAFVLTKARQALAPISLMAAFFFHVLAWMVAPGVHLSTTGHLTHLHCDAPDLHPHDPRPTVLTVLSHADLGDDRLLCGAALKNESWDLPQQVGLVHFQPAVLSPPVVPAVQAVHATPLGVPLSRSPPSLLT